MKTGATATFESSKQLEQPFRRPVLLDVVHRDGAFQQGLSPVDASPERRGAG